MEQIAVANNTQYSALKAAPFTLSESGPDFFVLCVQDRHWSIYYLLISLLRPAECSTPGCSSFVAFALHRGILACLCRGHLYTENSFKKPIQPFLSPAFSLKLTWVYTWVLSLALICKKCPHFFESLIDILYFEIHSLHWKDFSAFSGSSVMMLSAITNKCVRLWNVYIVQLSLFFSF